MSNPNWPTYPHNPSPYPSAGGYCGEHRLVDYPCQACAARSAYLAEMHVAPPMTVTVPAFPDRYIAWLTSEEVMLIAAHREKKAQDNVSS